MDKQKAIIRRIRSDLKYKEREPELLAKLTEEERKSAFLHRDFCQNTDINAFNDEIWFDVPGWEGLYQISNYIRLKSVRYGEIRRPRLNSKSYFDTSFHLGNKNKYYIYSRLVAIVFHPNPLSLPEVNHKNGIRWDNRPSNIEWATSKQNIQHSYEILGHVGKVKIIQMDMGGNFIKEWDSVSEAGKSLGKKCAGNITSTCKGKFNYAYGFKWKYKE